MEPLLNLLMEFLEQFLLKYLEETMELSKEQPEEISACILGGIHGRFLKKYMELSLVLK